MERSEGKTKVPYTDEIWQMARRRGFPGHRYVQIKSIQDICARAYIQGFVDAFKVIEERKEA